ncbi:TPA: SGNH/GDSL hydrolase family protein, partial [Klebsiella variicola]|nr:SGNH/GDSL hydrolase family protein [Klebsiella variicola]
MTNIFEKTNWADAIYQIARTDRVEGGASGTANKQAQQLADRTQYLKAMIESFNDAAEYTFYVSDDDPDGTIAG